MNPFVIVSIASDPTKPGVIVTRFGTFDPNPVAGAQIIPRNFGDGPGSVTANLRVSKTWSFGGEKQSSAARTQTEAMRAGEGGGMRGGMGGAGGGDRGGAGGGGRGGRGRGAGSGEAKRYSLTFSVNFQTFLTTQISAGRSAI